ncbi:MAG TPA: hypothetical protein VGP70_03025 [Actinomadura sp.]|nr:hypothetical protein [Actinomadura sp.]
MLTDVGSVEINAPRPGRQLRIEDRRQTPETAVRQDRKRWTMRWKPALNAFEISFDGRLAAGRK